MKLMLTSNGFYTESIKNEFLTLFDNEPGECKVAIITTASPQKENNRFAQMAKKDFKEMGFESIDFIDVEFDDPENLKQQDVIYINGGNPFTLLSNFKQSGADEVLRELVSKDIVVVGVSAGAVILGPTIKIVHFFTPGMNTPHVTDFSALELTKKLIFPHYDREDLFKDDTSRKIEERLKEFEVLERCEVTRLRDDECISIKI